MDWTLPAWLNSLISVGVGGLIVFAIQSWWTSRETKRAREVEYLKGQLRNLYGPLHMLASQNGLLLGLNAKLNSAYDKAFAGGGKLSEEAIQARNGQMDQTIKVMNQYSAKVRETNGRIVQILRDNWHLLDPEDMERLLEFMGYILRLQVEVEGEVRLPLDCTLSLPRIIIWKPELEALARERFLAKQKRLRDLTA